VRVGGAGAPRAAPFEPSDVPNTTWAADFKGQFRLGDRTVCYPLTISDLCSRYVLRVVGLAHPEQAAARVIFESA